MLAVKQELHEGEEPRCVLCEGEDATGYRIDEGRIVPASEAEVEADCFLCRECIERDDFEDQVRAYMVDRLKKQLEGGAAANRYWEHRGPCVLCEGEDAMGYRIDEEGIVPAFEAMVEADCFLCGECRERDDFEDQLRAYLERRGTYVDWLHNFDKPKEKLDCQLPIRMSKVTREKLEVAAKAHGVTLNKLVNSLIEGGLKYLPRKPNAG